MFSLFVGRAEAAESPTWQWGSTVLLAVLRKAERMKARRAHTASPGETTLAFKVSRVRQTDLIGDHKEQ